MKKLAINVALLPPPRIIDFAVDANKRLRSKQASALVLGEKTRIPHITLIQCIVKESDLEKVKTRLDEISHLNHPLKLTGKLDMSNDMSFIQIDVSAELYKLHKEVMDCLSDLGDHEDVRPGYFDDAEVRLRNQEWVRNFSRDSAYNNFAAHITLGDGILPDMPLQISFETGRLTLCSLGNRGTCKEILYEARLR